MLTIDLSLVPIFTIEYADKVVNNNCSRNNKSNKKQL